MGCMAKKLFYLAMTVAIILLIKKMMCVCSDCECKDKLCDIAKSTKDDAKKIGKDVAKDVMCDMKDAAKDMKNLASDTIKEVSGMGKSCGCGMTD